MARIELYRFIRAAPERVWPIISDLDSQTHWMEDLHRLEVVSDTRSGPGTVIVATSKLFGLPVLHDVMKVTTWEAPRLLEIAHVGQFTGTGVFRLEPAAEGCLFFWEEEFNPPLGSLGEWLANWVIAPHLRSVWGRSMDTVRRLAEANADEDSASSAGL